MDTRTGKYVVVMIDAKDPRAIYGVYECSSMSEAVNLRRILANEAQDADMDNVQGIVCQLLRRKK